MSNQWEVQADAWDLGPCVSGHLGSTRYLGLLLRSSQRAFSIIIAEQLETKIAAWHA